MTDSIDLEAVEKKIQEEYRRALDALQTLKKYLGNGSNGHFAPIVIDHTNRQDEPELRDADFVDLAEDYPQTIIGRVAEIVEADSDKKWTVPGMVAYLRNTGFEFETKTPGSTINLVFAKLRKRGKVRLVRRGAGRSPNAYRAVQTTPQEGASEQSSQNERTAS